MFAPTKIEGSGTMAGTVIGEAIKIEGSFTGSGDVTVKGMVVGSLNTDHDVIIETSAKVEADIVANNLSVAGEIKGNVTCRGCLTVKSTARIYGDVTAEVLAVESGATIQGRCTTGTKSTTDTTN